MIKSVLPFVFSMNEEKVFTTRTKDNCVSKAVYSNNVEISESNSIMKLDLKRMNTWNRIFVDTSSSMPVKAESISTRLKSIKSHIEKKSNLGPSKAVSLRKKKIRDLSFEIHAR
jgi:hypothetical protein